MKELNEYTSEVHRRVELKVQTQRQHRIRALALCVPLVLCVAAASLFLPKLLSRAGTDGQSGAVWDSGSSGMEQNGLPADAANPPDGEAAPVGSAGQMGQQDGALGADGAADAIYERSVPEDFSFRFVWGCYGISSYDSETGKLVKTTDATHPEDYETTLELDEEQRAEIWALLSALELAGYPAHYDPYNDPASTQKVASEPNRNLILTLRTDGKETTVSCIGICLGGFGHGYDEKAQRFLDTCDRLTNLLTGTPEWEALPDYEFLYE